MTPWLGIVFIDPPNGGEFVTMTTLLEEEYPLSKVQVSVKIKEDWAGRLFPINTKLSKFGDKLLEAERNLDVEERETAESPMELSLTDHTNRPLDFISTLPKIFNLEEGFIFTPERACRVSTGASDSRIEI